MKKILRDKKHANGGQDLNSFRNQT